ncbi:MAG: hypothetical protein KC442_19520 [Thermomicrobiales bacterium]|nr:hypothetical protein [Thermomicrobiales bacterium]
MDGKQFDHVARALQADHPRRGVAGLLLGGVLGLAGLAESQAKGGKGKGGKGKKKKRKKKQTTCMKAAANCSGSSCGMGDTCCSQIDCDCRQNLYCNFNNPKSDSGTCGCDGDDVMHNGRCGSKPVCTPTGTKRALADPMCCSGSAITDINNPAVGTCLPGNLLCLSNADCTGGACRGYKCYAPELDCNVYF